MGELKAMNSTYPAYEFDPKIDPIPWEKVFKGRMPKEANDLAGGLLCYAPLRRLPPLHALTHSFFDQLRNDRRDTHTQLFNFLKDELWWATPQDRDKLVQ